jgi:surface antigen
MIDSIALPRRTAVVLAAVAMTALSPPARADTYGTDGGACDRGALSGVLSTSSGNLLGSAAGAAAGGLLGNQFGKGGGNTALTVVGVLAGALAGGYVGRSMEPVDQACVGRALEHTPTHQTVAWQNPDTKSSYWVTPTRTYNDGSGTTCRDYTTDALVDGERQRLAGSSCRQPDGSWRLKDERDETSAVRAVAADHGAARNGAPNYRGYSDRELHDAYARLGDQESQLKREQASVRGEMTARGIRP